MCLRGRLVRAVPSSRMSVLKISLRCSFRPCLPFGERHRSHGNDQTHVTPHRLACRDVFRSSDVVCTTVCSFWRGFVFSCVGRMSLRPLWTAVCLFVFWRNCWFFFQMFRLHVISSTFCCFRCVSHSVSCTSCPISDAAATHAHFPPRPIEYLLSQETTTPEQMKRPHMDAFLTAVYEHYDLAIWSQTSWRWLELKLTELGFLNNPNFR